MILQRDLELLNQYKVGLCILISTPDQIIQQVIKSWINVEELSSILCGASRPGHFRGVATVITKLINIIKPSLMFMGEKDIQQIVVFTNNVEGS